MIHIDLLNPKSLDPILKSDKKSAASLNTTLDHKSSGSDSMPSPGGGTLSIIGVNVAILVVVVVIIMMLPSNVAGPLQKAFTRLFNMF